MDKKEKTFDTIKWIRGVRQELFEKYYKGNLTEYLKAISTPSINSKNKFSEKPISKRKLNT